MVYRKTAAPFKRRGGHRKRWTVSAHASLPAKTPFVGGAKMGMRISSRALTSKIQSVINRDSQTRTLLEPSLNATSMLNGTLYTMAPLQDIVYGDFDQQRRGDKIFLKNIVVSGTYESANAGITSGNSTSQAFLRHTVLWDEQKYLVSGNTGSNVNGPGSSWLLNTVGIGTPIGGPNFLLGQDQGVFSLINNKGSSKVIYDKLHKVQADYVGETKILNFKDIIKMNQVIEYEKTSVNNQTVANYYVKGDQLYHVFQVFAPGASTGGASSIGSITLTGMYNYYNI